MTERCAQHRAVAGWRCTVCEAALCPDCAATKVVPPISLVVCTRCGEMADPLLRLRSETASLSQRIMGAFRFPFRGDGLVVWLGVSLWLWPLSLAGALGTTVGWAVALGTFFGVTRSTARGGEDLELTDSTEMVRDAVVPTLRFVVVLMPAWGGAWLAVGTGHAEWLWMAALLAWVWSPTAFIGAATGAQMFDLMNPLRVLGAAARLGKDLPVYLVAVLGISVVIGLSIPLSMAVRSLWAPVVAGVMAQMVLAYGPMVFARVAGFILLLHGPVFGWGEERDLYEPVLGATLPQGVAPAGKTGVPR